MHLTQPPSNACNTNAITITIATFPDDCLPPKCYFESQEALFESINSWAKPRGYAFTTQRSMKEKNGTRTVIYTCNQACNPPNSLVEHWRKTTT
ncbi:hypothetical protein NDA14_004056 [Ustilago hordei]|nr:hypothetical protein NDA12_000179 [Ustilago hordei]KAJ1592386.1 hypothetical protein NDA15_001283 [Ustilago hordei]KAJ1595821.1 hypothetical protein NDA14_004056 [Ustilago hordei]UTT89869.1 hypothetical protein NDA17_003830 [Ustilago hordei]